MFQKFFRCSVQKRPSWNFLTAHNFNQGFVQQRRDHGGDIHAAQILHLGPGHGLFVSNDGQGLKRRMAGLTRTFLHLEFHNPGRILGIRPHLIAACNRLNAEAPVFSFVFRLQLQDDFLNIRRLDAPQNLFDFGNGHRLSTRKKQGLHNPFRGFVIHLQGLVQLLHFHAERGHDDSFLGKLREHFLLKLPAQFFELLFLFFFFCFGLHQLTCFKRISPNILG